MTIEIVRQRLDAAITESKPKVVLLTGGWGAGKTYQWREALKRGQAKHTMKFAYVSLFGIGTLAEARKRLSEELVSALSIPNNHDTIGELASDVTTKLKLVQSFKLLPLIPFLSKAEGLLNDLSFATVRNAVICIDDLERKNKGLTMAEIFGLASFLKEERKCRVILIANDKKFDVDGSADASVYLEKVVDEHIDFVPTPQEACDIALTPNPDHVGTLLRRHLLDLGVSNIRVVSRLRQLVAELATTVTGLDEEVLTIGVRALTVFGLGHYLPGGDFPPSDYILQEDEGADWLQWVAQDKSDNEVPQTEDEKRAKRWNELLSRLGGPGSDPYEVALSTTIKQGYMPCDLRVMAERLHASLQDRALVEKFHAAWKGFWHSLNGTGDALLDSLLETSRSAVRVVGPGDLQPAYEVFVAAGRQADADVLVADFIEARKATPAIFDRSKAAFPEHYRGRYGELLQAAAEQHTVKPSIEEALDRIQVDSHWNSANVRVVAQADAADIERLLRGASGQLFRARIRTFLQLGKIAPADEPRAAEVTATTETLIQTWAAADPVTAIRLGRYLPKPAATPA